MPVRVKLDEPVGASASVVGRTSVRPEGEAVAKLAVVVGRYLPLSKVSLPVAVVVPEVFASVRSGRSVRRLPVVEADDSNFWLSEASVELAVRDSVVSSDWLL